jgi:hypothetical protein
MYCKKIRRKAMMSCAWVCFGLTAPDKVEENHE